MTLLKRQFRESLQSVMETKVIEKVERKGCSCCNEWQALGARMNGRNTSPD